MTDARLTEGLAGLHSAGWGGFFFAYVIIKGRQQGKEDRGDQKDMRGSADPSEGRKDDG